MVEGPPIALRCRNTRGRTLAVSRQQARQADDHPPSFSIVWPRAHARSGARGRRRGKSSVALAEWLTLFRASLVARHPKCRVLGAAHSRALSAEFFSPPQAITAKVVRGR